MSKLQVDDIVNKGDNGAPGFSKGAVVTGVCTATSFSGSLTGTADLASGLTGTPDVTVRNITGVGMTLSGTLNYEDVTNVDSVGIITAQGGVRVTGGYSKLTGVVETVSAATTYMSGADMVLELDMQGATTYTYTNVGDNIGIVSFKNLPADAQNGATVTLIHTQNASTPSGLGNTTAATGLGLTCTVVPYVSGSPITGITTAALVGSGTTVTLSTTAADRDFVSFFVHYTGGTTSTPSSYQVYATKNGDFRHG